MRDRRLPRRKVLVRVHGIRGSENDVKAAPINSSEIRGICFSIDWGNLEVWWRPQPRPLVFQATVAENSCSEPLVCGAHPPRVKCHRAAVSRIGLRYWSVRGTVGPSVGAASRPCS